METKTGLKLSKLSLSKNQETAVVDSDDSKNVPELNGKLNQMSDGRNFYMAIFKDPSNPFARERVRVISEDTTENGNTFRSGHPQEVKNFIGNIIPGSYVATRKVQPYTVNTGEGSVEVNTYSAVILPGENVETIFRSSGHEIVAEEAAEAVSEEAKAAAAADEMDA